MDLKEYEASGHALYSDFCAIVAELLHCVIQEEGRYKLQHMQARTKDLCSFKSLIRRKKCN